MARMTREDAEAFREQWRALKEVEHARLLEATLLEKLEKTNMLMEVARIMNWKAAAPREDRALSDKWLKLRKHYERTRAD